MADEFAQGGVVPGSGDGDYVPAMIDPPGCILTAREVAELGAVGVIRELRRKLRETDGRDG